jgi:hypothetical protein
MTCARNGELVQHDVVAVTVDAQGRDECGQTLEHLLNMMT